jgi:thiol:disulfide interchange protein
MDFFATIQRAYASNKRASLFAMRRSHLIVAIALLFTAALPAVGASDSAEAPHVHVRLIVLPQALSRGSAADGGLYFKLEPGWHVYWKNAGDSGEPPHIRWTLPDGISAGPLQFLAPKRLPLGPLMDFGYEGEALFPFAINVSNAAKPGPVDLRAKVDWLVCREVCIPGKAELSVRRNLSLRAEASSPNEADEAIFTRFAEQLPRPMPPDFEAVFQPSGDGFRLAVQTGQQERSAAFFPADQNILDNPAPQKLTPTPSGLILDLKKDTNLSANPARLSGVLELSGGRAYELTAMPGVVTGASAMPAESSVKELFRISGLAFLGGLLLNLMPCVFPVLFIKGLALVRSGNEDRRKLRAHGLVYTAGILISFWALVAVLVGLRTAGTRLGWGFQFQSPVFLMLMAALLFFLGLSLAGQFEIGLSLTGAGGSLASRQGYTGSFFTGVLAVIVATPCTAPFMGAAVGYALAQSPAVTFAVFTALALGLAAPYVALTLQPAWTRLLPHPGVWMEILKQATAVPVFATVIWLAWVLAQAYGSALLVALLTILLLLAIAGWFLGRWPAKKWATAIAVVVVIAVIAVSVVVPGKLGATTAAASPTLTPSGWEPWSAERVARYQVQGRPVFVDFTASWCLSCQVNERVALNQPSVQRAFADANVALLRADWTQHDESIAQALTSMGRSGVPAYALYAPGQSSPQLLPEVLTPGIVMDAVGKLSRSATQATAASSNLK